MALLPDLFALLSFLSGAAFGVVVAAVAALHLLSAPPGYVEDIKAKHEKELEKMRAEDAVNQGSMGDEESEQLNRIVDFLDDANSPLKNMSTVLQRIHLNKDSEVAALETKMKTIIDHVTLVRMEKDFQDSVAELKDHTKSLKALSTFLNDVGKTFNSISRDLSRLANSARSSMNKNTSLERKEDLIVNNWWQTLQVALDHMASDQEDLATIISEELLSYSSQIQEEIAIIDKRLLVEGTKQFAAVKENIQLFEARLRDREKIKEKMRTAISSSGSEKEKEKVKRASKYKASEESLILQTKKLYEAQKEFYSLMPRIASDVQLTIIKSIVETQSQLFKLSEGMDRAQHRHSHVTKRMRAQLNNAAASLVQMIREECKLIPDESTGAPSATSIALDAMRQRMTEQGLQGYEISLQKVLESLLAQAKIRGLTVSEAGPSTPARGSDASTAPLGVLPGKLDMFNEATACLAACNPTLLPMLPRAFNGSIGMETCVWFNAFIGRVYRDIASSKYFYHWFCSKLTTMLNKNEKERPAFIDRFQVVDVMFGDLPPLICNVKWSPPVARKPDKDRDEARDRNRSDKAAARKRHQPGSGEDSSDSEDESAAEKLTTEDIESRARDFPDSDEEMLFYAACTADVAFRSGIKFTIATQLFLNWPRDRYVSVPVLLHLDVSEVAGRMRFGCTRAYSFISFLHQPLLRINVRSEVGSEKYRFKDIPQASEYIERKLKDFINRKIVYPHSHKFRLIWPRNWWPEGTEGLFMPQGGLPEEAGQNSSFAQPQAPASKEKEKEREKEDETKPKAEGISSKFSSFFKPPVVAASAASAATAATTNAAPQSAQSAALPSPQSPPPATHVTASTNSSPSALAAPVPSDPTARRPSAPAPLAAPAPPAAPVTSDELWRNYIQRERSRSLPEPELLGPSHRRVVLSAMFDDYSNEEDEDAPHRTPSFDAAHDRPRRALRRVRSLGDFRPATSALAWQCVLREGDAAEREHVAISGSEDLAALPVAMEVKHVDTLPRAARARVPRKSGLQAERADSGEERGRREEVRALLARGKAHMQTARAKLSAFKERHLGPTAKLSELLFADDHAAMASPPRAPKPVGQSEARSPETTKAPEAAKSPEVSRISEHPRPQEGPRVPASFSGKRPSLNGGGEEGGGGTSSAMKYVASMFRATSTGTGAGEGESERRRSLVRDDEAPGPVHSQTHAHATGSVTEGKSRMKDMFSKAFSSVRQQLDKDKDKEP